MDSDTFKIFVGNVPFQCSQYEFVECFENIKGFIKAEIMYGLNTSLSRGFGFVTFDNKKNALEVIDGDPILFKGRPLRLTNYKVPYNTHDDNIILKEQYNKYATNKQHVSSVEHVSPNEQIDNIKNKHFMMVKWNLTSDDQEEFITREYLHKAFQKFGAVGRYFIMTDHETGNSKHYAIVEMKEENVYEQLLNKKEMLMMLNDRDEMFELSRWKVKQPTYREHKQLVHTGNKYFR